MYTARLFVTSHSHSAERTLGTEGAAERQTQCK